MSELEQAFTIQRDGSYFRLLNAQKERIGHIHVYLDEKHRYIIDSTVVDINYRGQGLANQLLNTVIALAREEKKYIYPLCSFAVKVLQHERYRDLWDPQEGSPTGGYCSWIPSK
jgi:uncharacterized protein